jgi:DNA-binding winged helix-turn-helix (wHTH) protein
MLYRLGSNRLDIERRLLLREGREQEVSPKAFDLLVTLLSARPAVMTKEELMAQIWPDTFVSDANLAVLIGEIRAAIGDSARSPRFIKTHHGVGYSFIGEVTELPRREPVPLGPTFFLHVDDRRILLPQGTLTVGRDEPADVVLKHPSVSRQHARLEVEGLTLTITDLGSKNGTRVAGKRITGPQAVADGDRVTFGKVDATVILHHTTDSTTVTMTDIE